MNGISKKCTCGHVLSDHISKRLTKEHITIKEWHGECQWDDCDCMMFKNI